MNRDRKKIIIMLTVFLLLPATFLSAQSTTGYINYLEGTVSVSRNGHYLASNKISAGLILEEYDVVETGPDGFVEIEIRSDNSSNGTIVRVKENTSYYFKMAESGKKKNTVFQMLKGSVSFKVKKLTNDDSLEVYTSTTTMGVRGTQFVVTAIPDGSVLITCDEGKVSCSSDSTETFAYPGQIAEKVPQSSIRSKAVNPEDLDEFTNKWIDARLEALRINIPVSLDYYTSQFEMYYPKFLKAHQKIMENKAILDKWDKYLKEGTVPPMSEAKKDEIILSPAMMEMRSILPIFELTFYTLDDLLTYYEKGFGKGSVSGKTQKKINSFLGDRENARNLLTEARYYYRLYLEIKKASLSAFPDTDFSPGIDTDSFFN